MRIASFSADGQSHYGVITDAGAIALSADFPDWPTLREVIAAAALLESEFEVSADVWSVTSFNELARDGLATARWNRLHPGEDARLSYVERCLGGRGGPVLASSDYQSAVADQIRAFVPARYAVLGTDGFGRSDTRRKLRTYFEVDRYSTCAAALSALAADGAVSVERVGEAIRKYGLDPERIDPASV